MNVHDSEKLTGLLLSLDWEQVSDPEAARIIILNTCSVREKAEQKVFSRLGRLAPLKKQQPDLKIVLAGCMAKAWGRKLFKRNAAIDLVLGPGVLHRLPEYIADINAGKSKLVDVSETNAIFSLPPDLIPETSRISAWVTVMEGCNNFCSYCIVPFVRGRERSRPAADIVAEVKFLASRGVREVTLLGQNVNSYTGDPGGFPALLEKLQRVEGILRIRFTTSHPKDMSDRLIDAVAALPKVCNYLHFPIQSGSNRILRKMRRGYTREHYLERVERIRNTIPEVALSSDFIVGFPGETADDFAQTLEVLQSVRYENIFAFNYSVRAGTAAEKIPDTVPLNMKTRRLIKLIDMERAICLEINQNRIGTVQQVLVDGPAKRGGNKFTGRTTQNRIINFDGPAIPGTLQDVIVESASPNCLYGRLV